MVSCRSSLVTSFVFACSGSHRDLHSFPTRRSSDLAERVGVFELVHVLVVHEVPLARVVELGRDVDPHRARGDRKSTRLNSSHVAISYAVFCLKKKKETSANVGSRQRNRSLQWFRAM